MVATAGRELLWCLVTGPDRTDRPTVVLGSLSTSPQVRLAPTNVALGDEDKVEKAPIGVERAAELNMTRPGLEPGISGSGTRRLIH